MTFDDDNGGCKHYRNKCEILAPCCLEYVRCFRCHDDDIHKKCTNPTLDRANITTIRCVECKLEQEPATHCQGCHIAFAEHVCLECNLYRQNHEDGLFHCPDCGICRVGKGLGISHWHCRSCVACLSVDVDPEQHAIVCRPLAAKEDCCICFERLHDSQDELVIGPYCGHYLHKSCCDAYFQTGKTQCPICTMPLVEETDDDEDKIRNRTEGEAIQNNHPMGQIAMAVLCAIFMLLSIILPSILIYYMVRYMILTNNTKGLVVVLLLLVSPTVVEGRPMWQRAIWASFISYIWF